MSTMQPWHPRLQDHCERRGRKMGTQLGSLTTEQPKHETDKDNARPADVGWGARGMSKRAPVCRVDNGKARVSETPCRDRREVSVDV